MVIVVVGIVAKILAILVRILWLMILRCKYKSLHKGKFEVEASTKIAPAPEMAKSDPTEFPTLPEPITKAEVLFTRLERRLPQQQERLDELRRMTATTFVFDLDQVIDEGDATSPTAPPKKTAEQEDGLDGRHLRRLTQKEAVMVLAMQESYAVERRQSVYDPKVEGLEKPDAEVLARVVMRHRRSVSEAFKKPGVKCISEKKTQLFTPKKFASRHHRQTRVQHANRALNRVSPTVHTALRPARTFGKSRGLRAASKRTEIVDFDETEDDVQLLTNEISFLLNTAEEHATAFAVSNTQIEQKWRGPSSMVFRTGAS